MFDPDAESLDNVIVLESVIRQTERFRLGMRNLLRVLPTCMHPAGCTRVAEQQSPEHPGLYYCPACAKASGRVTEPVPWARTLREARALVEEPLALPATG